MLLAAKCGRVKTSGLDKQIVSLLGIKGVLKDLSKETVLVCQRLSGHSTEVISSPGASFPVDGIVRERIHELASSVGSVLVR